MNGLPFLADLESNLDSCSDAIGSIIDLANANDNEQRLTALTNALREVRALEICLKDWIENAKDAGYPVLGGGAS